MQFHYLKYWQHYDVFVNKNVGNFIIVYFWPESRVHKLSQISALCNRFT